MQKQRIAYLLRQLTLTAEEFSAETHIPAEKLKNREPDAATVQAVVRYFSARGQPQEKSVIREVLRREKGRLHIDDASLFDALEDYLSGNASFCHHPRTRGAGAGALPLYPADSILFEGEPQIRRALSLFAACAVRLRPLRPSVILYSPSLLTQYGLDPAVAPQLAAGAVRTVAAELPFFFSLPAKVLVGIIPDHFLLEIYAREKPLAVLTRDAVKANSLWLQLCGSAVQEPGAAVLSYFRIAALLELTGMHNDKLAEQLYLDKTLISKWKNGKRKLQCYDETLRQLASALYHTAPHIQKKLRCLLEAYFPLAPDSSEDEVIFCLCKWLSYREEARSLPTRPAGAAGRIRYGVYAGFLGLRDAVQMLLSRCQQIKTPFQLYLTCFDHPEYLCRLDSTLLQLLQQLQHCHFTFTFQSCFALSQLADLLLRSVHYPALDSVLTHLLLTGGLTLQCRHLASSVGCSILAVVPDTVALEVVQTAGVPDQLCTRSYLEGETVQKFYQAAVPAAAEGTPKAEGRGPCGRAL